MRSLPQKETRYDPHLELPWSSGDATGTNFIPCCPISLSVQLAGRTMKSIGLRLIVALVVGITLVSTVSSWYEVRQEKQSLYAELERKAETLADGLTNTAELMLLTGDRQAVEGLSRQFSHRGQLLGMTVLNAAGQPLSLPQAIAPLLRRMPPEALAALHTQRPEKFYTRIRLRRVFVLVVPLSQVNRQPVGALVLVYDTGYIRTATLRVWALALVHFGVQVLLIAVITLGILRWMLLRPIARAAEWLRLTRMGNSTAASPPVELDFLAPLTSQVTPLIESMQEARAAAAAEARLRNARAQIWTAQRLADHVRTKLAGSRLYVVSNREPYIHNHTPQGVRVQVPASGLVTALEPSLCACNGTWIAHGSGSADREMSDEQGRLPAPPDEPRYTLRRVWLTEEQEQGYYYGFANEGLWPLCHIAHARPTFRAGDWEQYVRVNEKFAHSLVEEIGDNPHPVVLIQDYHFALLPRMLKQRLPHARVAIFWHIPWPNPESFGICPWQRELVHGLLGADMIGFHVQAHCNNFLDTVDRALEARVDWEHFSVKRNDHWSLVRPIPISVDLPPDEYAAPAEEPDALAEIQRQWNFEASVVAIGVDRMDYTKGILERFQAVESMLDRHAEFQGEFALIQIGAPTRSTIPRYAELQREIEQEAERINARFRRGNWRPIVLVQEQQDHRELGRYYRAAAICLVTSLHDGMNLVAKEFVAARRDEHGVLILSRFTGAARELRDALIVNPYDIAATGDAIAQALRMDAAEITDRMRRMRRWVSDHNIYWWANRLLSELCELRLETSGAPMEEPVGAAKDEGAMGHE